MKSSLLHENTLDKYGLVSKLGEGTFSNVFKVVKKETNEYYSIKIMKRKFTSYDAVYSLPEVKFADVIGKSENILNVHEIIYEPKIGRLSIVYNYMEKDLLTLLQEGINEEEIVLYAHQLIKGISYLHALNLMHRDLKPENILINPKTKELRIGDLGSIESAPCEYIQGVYITTIWYRAPEILLKAPKYSKESDIWAAGCIIAEMIVGRPVFTGHTTNEQLMKIHNAFGAPTDEIFDAIGADSRYKAFQFKNVDYVPLEQTLRKNGYSNDDMIDLVTQMLQYVPDDRITADIALKYPAFIKII